MSLEDLRARNKDGNLDQFIKAVSKSSEGKKKTYNDTQEVTYYPERDKEGNGSCILRFLPGLESEDFLYYIERFQHGFQINGKWYIEFCPTTPEIDEKCPVCQDSFDIKNQYGKWEDCPESVQKMLRPRSRTNGFKAGYYCNVLVVKDPVNPENEGKVHLFKFGIGIYRMIYKKIYPQDDGLGTTPKGVDPFNLVSGANFKFIIHKKDGRADYSSSVWEDPTACPDYDLSQMTPLYPIVDKKLFKSYEDLEKRFNIVMGTANKPAMNNAEEAVNQGMDQNAGSDIPPVDENIPPVDTDAQSDTSISDDENMAYFQDIADEVKI